MKNEKQNNPPFDTEYLLKKVTTISFLLKEPKHGDSSWNIFLNKEMRNVIEYWMTGRKENDET